MTTTTNLTAALTLVSVLTSEGYLAVWHRASDNKSINVITNAPNYALLACVSTANTLAGAR